MQLIRNGNATEVFWGEIAPCDHMVQIYDTDEVFMDSLEGYFSGGIQRGDSVILIATGPHIAAVEERLLTRGIDLERAKADDKYIALDAEEMLALFMVDGWPDEERFRAAVSELLTRAQRSGRHVRAFGEMVAVLWGKGLYAATVRLEHLWHRFCLEGGFSLLCAYPQSGVTGKTESSLREICEAHTHVLTGSGVFPQ